MLRAQGAAVKIGVLHPVSGALSYSGQQGRLGATMAIDDINAAGGIKALGGAKIDPMLGDAQSTPDGGNAEVEKMNCGRRVAPWSAAMPARSAWPRARPRRATTCPMWWMSASSTASSPAGLKNTFRFGPGFGVIAKTALDNLVTINDQAGKPAKTVMIVHEDSAFGAGLAKLLNAQLPDRGFQVLETIPHPTPTREFESVVLKIKAQNPDLVIPANYYNEYVLLARTMQQQRVRPKGIYSVLGGAASSYKFVKEFPEAAQYIMDCNHWFDPKNPKALALKKRVEDKGQFYTYEVYMNYSCMLLLADALERAASTDRAKITDALAKLDLQRALDALWTDQVRQRPERGRGAGQYAGAGQRHPGDPAAAVCLGEAGLPDAAGLRSDRLGVPNAAMLSPVILVPAVLNGLMTGAVYALVALGLTLVYGVLAHHQFRAWRAA